MAFRVLGFTVLFLLWMCCTAEQGKNGCGPPPRKDQEELQASSRKASYAHEDVVLYNCRPGYIKLGRIRYQCTDGEWIPATTNSECRSKPCGHPGDIQFGTFDLVKGTDFSFGARVVYQCDEGYKMLSQINYRDCRVEGWSNAVPHCEVMKCFPVKPPENGRIIMTGIQDIEQEFLFGQVLRFECSPHFKLEGSDQIFCAGHGDWNAPVPKCVEITCKVENIDHGYITFASSLSKEGDRVELTCETGYKPVDRSNAVCTRNGWSSRLECIEITCHPPQIENGNFHPVRNQYEYEDTIQTDCESGYQVESRDMPSKCTANGWLPIPRCIPKTCDYPHIPNGGLSRTYEYWKHHYFPRSVGQTIDFWCSQGFLAVNKQAWHKATCTKFGFTPEPKCFRQCGIARLPNGHFNVQYWATFIEGEETTFTCNNGYAPLHKQTTITCTGKGWSPAPSCIIQARCEAIAPNNGFFTEQRRYFTLNQKARYSCQSGFTTPEGRDREEIRCLERGWEPEPKCLRSCPVPTGENIVFNRSKNVFLSGETLHYECREGFETDQKTTDGSTKCRDNVWHPQPSCLPIRCEPFRLEHGNLDAMKDQYFHGDVVKFSCFRRYKRVGPQSAQCYQFGWSPQPPKCKTETEIKPCQQPPSIADGVSTSDPSEEYKHGAKVEFECNIGFALVGSKEIECVDGEWTSLPSCSEEQNKCGSPPNITNGHAINVDSDQYLHGDTVTYECMENSGFEEKKATCVRGQWELPSCSDSAANCGHPKNPQIVFQGPRREEYQHSTTATYVCDSKILRTECINGKWAPKPVCKVKADCPPPPQIPNAINIFQVRNYGSGEEVSFRCEEHFLLQGSQKILCENGKWQTPPRCIDTRCGDPPLPPHSVIKNTAIKNSVQEKYLPGESVEYDCFEGFEISETKFVRCENRKWSQPPSCQEKSCGEPPVLFDAAYDINVKKKYQPGERVTYTCHPGFVAEGQTNVTCQKGKWSSPSICVDATCKETPRVDNADLVERMAGPYLPGQQLNFQCHEGFDIFGPPVVTCEKGKWSELPKCEDATCPPPPRISNGEVRGPLKEKYLPLEKVRYRCFKQFSLVGPYAIKCVKKQWTEIPQCQDVGGKCSRPPAIENGDIVDDILPAYEPGRRVHYQCQNLYKMEGSPFVRCENGHWTDPPTCIDPCTAAEEDMEHNNIRLKWVHSQKLYSESGDEIEFACKWGYVAHPSSPPFRTRCTEGKLVYPTCIRDQ